eukprot:TRINITY_DN21535_c0_g2_i1.p1 TRINITY_DN21535_c0_g2~~TRINITY_DN21535_c0_g2_i1.p1  ORF type:complete len:679 (-),score=160.03 TRINITY_DN21535_c0_g2_i1:851-2887(-)
MNSRFERQSCARFWLSHSTMYSFRAAEIQRVHAELPQVLDQLTNNELKVSCLDLGVLQPAPLDQFMQQIDRMLLNNRSVRTLAFCGIQNCSRGVITAAVPVMGQPFLKSLETNTLLHTLNLEECSMSDAILKELFDALKNNRGLLTLDLSANNFTQLESIAEALEKGIPLQKLSLARNKHIADGQWTRLSQSLLKNQNLLSLDLHMARLSADEAIALAKALHDNSTLRELIITHNHLGEQAGPAFIEMLEYNSGLLYLDLSNNKIPASAFQRFHRAMKKNETLSVLVLRKNELGSLGAQLVANGLAVNKSLCTLNLNDNFIYDSGIRALVSAMMSKTQENAIRDLGIADNKIGYFGALALAQFFRSANCKLQSVDISGNRFSPEGVSAIIEGIRLNPSHSLSFLHMSALELSLQNVQELAGCIVSTSLRGLELDECELQDDGAMVLAKMLMEREAKLEYFSVDSNRIGPIGLASIFKALRTNTCLKFLCVVGNDIGDVGASECAIMLKLNTQLEDLAMDYTGLSSSGAVDLCKAIESSRTLDLVCLKFNNLKDSMAKHVADVIEHNSSMVAFWIDNNLFSQDSAKLFEESMKSNTSIIRSLNAGYGSHPSSYCLPAILKNQARYLDQVKFSLAAFILQQSGTENKRFLVDLSLVRAVYKYYDLPQTIYCREQYSALYS